MPDRPANSPFIRDVPAAQALDAWRAAREAAGCPDRLPAVTVPVAEAGELVLPEGHRLRAVDLAAAAAAGATHLSVRKKALVFILTTGDEVRTASRPR